MVVLKAIDQLQIFDQKNDSIQRGRAGMMMKSG